MGDIAAAVGICLFYGTSSMMLSFVNKAIFTAYDFKYPLVILLTQFLVNVILTLVVKYVVRPSPEKAYLWKCPEFSKQDAIDNLVVTFSFLANVLAGIFALSMVNIPMFLALRRLATLFLYSIDVLIMKKPIIAAEVIGVSLIALGAIVAGANDLNADGLGYFLVFLNNIITSFSFHIAKRVSQKNPRLDAATQTFYNAAEAIPIIFLAVCLNGDLGALFYSSPGTLSFYLCMFFGSCMGCLLTFSQTLCNTKVSPMATSITGNLKDIFSTALGLFAFGDVEINQYLLLGLVLSLLGAMCYSFSKYLEAMKTKYA
jgi:solute carrier family 35 protein